MSISLEVLGIDRLSVRDKLDLIELIWGSLPEQVNPDEVPEWHRAELAKRRAEADASPRAGKPWREAPARFTGGSSPSPDPSAHG
jgi:putative addiction module component (TIGR02574 family)